MIVEVYRAMLLNYTELYLSDIFEPRWSVVAEGLSVVVYQYVAVFG